MTELAPLSRVLERHGLCLDELRRSTQAIALFGSRAAGCATSSSDWDLLCVGDGHFRDLAAPDIDIVWASARTLTTSDWLGSELAGHVTAHAIWIDGEMSWDSNALDFAAAARRKEAVVARKVVALARAWRFLGADYQAKHATSLRRHVQRWRCLEESVCVPPTRTLDDRWAFERHRHWLTERFTSLGALPDLARSLTRSCSCPPVVRDDAPLP